MRKKRTFLQSVLLYATVLFWCFIVLFPFYWLLTTSIKTQISVSRGPKYLPSFEVPFITIIDEDGNEVPYTTPGDFIPTGQHWQDLFTRDRDEVVRHFRNSLIAASGSTILALIIGSMAGYGLSRFKYYWGRLGWDNENIAFWIISNRFLPPALFVVPFLLIYSRLGLIDTHSGLIIAYTMFNLPFAVWIMRDFFNGLPIELEESAMIDGASRVTAFLRIVLPLSAPGLVAVAIFSFVFSWNEYLYALMLTNFEAITMPVLIAGQNNTRGIQWWFISALTLTAVAPVVVIGLLLERYITRGLVAGAIKG
ncbi:MAG: carbohydrate ABC transporter permease [Anaerolineae bacterium]|nr:carbohydrate ABC transporter permease [Anaerolineae bacterium]